MPSLALWAALALPQAGVFFCPAALVAQQPGGEAEVHTGTGSGLDADQRLRNLLADHQFLRLEQELDHLSADDAQFYRGLLANRSNHSQKSAELLEPLLEKVVASGNLEREKLIRRALGEDYLRQGDWQKAAEAYAALQSRLGAKLSPDEQDELELPTKLLPLAKDNPRMTVDPCDAFEMQVEKNPLGLIDIPVFVDADPRAMMLDPTSPFNLMAHSLAKAVGLKLSEQAVTIHTLTGKPIPVHMAVVPRFTVGGRLTLRNMTVFVFEDADYYFPINHYQVEGVLGYPAVSAFGAITITADDTVSVRPEKRIDTTVADDRVTQGARFFLDGDQIVVALGKARDPKEAVPVKDDERMYVIDAGSQQTYLTSRYFDEHASEFAQQKLEMFTIPGPLNLPPQPAYMAETIPLVVGPTTVRVHYVEVLTQPVGAAALDDVYGVLGIDALDQLSAYTFDYRTMLFSVKPQ